MLSFNAALHQTFSNKMISCNSSIIASYNIEYDNKNQFFSNCHKARSIAIRRLSYRAQPERFGPTARQYQADASVYIAPRNTNENPRAERGFIQRPPFSGTGQFENSAKTSSIKTLRCVKLLGVEQKKIFLNARPPPN
jgi:hypothetical protein